MTQNQTHTNNFSNDGQDREACDGWNCSCWRVDAEDVQRWEAERKAALLTIAAFRSFGMNCGQPGLNTINAKIFPSENDQWDAEIALRAKDLRDSSGELELLIAKVNGLLRLINGRETHVKVLCEEHILGDIRGSYSGTDKEMLSSLPIMRELGR